MPDRKIINIVGTRCRPQDEEKFNKWYNEIHIPMLLKFKGLKGAARYKLAGESAEMPTYIAIYEFASRKDFEDFGQSPEFAAAIEEMQKSWPSGIEILVRTPYELIKKW
jgi:uncharacterized protein (TIGR02118 family)